MTLSPGTRLGPYQISAQIGAGGMGEVYRATDGNLGRQVAIKVLPEALASDTRRLARFDREAKALASMNHPNIAAIYGLEKSHGTTALVMELVEGPTLADRIAHGAIPLDETLAIAKQIAQALEAAHEQGIIHRDLKPANIKVRSDGTVKILDFGLAKATDQTGSSDEMQAGDPAPTMTLPTTVTGAGVILGTPAYMAPEQAKGHVVDRRADIFAFGCVLYEMLSGRRAFEGESTPDVLSRVLNNNPDWTRVPPHVPAAIHRLLRLCLQKDPKARRQAAGDVRIDLEQALSEAESFAHVVRDRSRRSLHLMWALITVAVAAALAIPAVVHFGETPPSEVRLQIVTPPTRAPLEFALSPDGRHIVFVASDGGTERLFVRSLDKSDAQPLTGTDGAGLPFWSPDSRSVGFFASGQLRRMEISGGPAEVLAPAPAAMGGAWNSDGTILFAPNTVSPLLRVPASGGESTAVTQLDRPRHTGHQWPSFLPDGRQFLFFVLGEPNMTGIYLGYLDGRTPKRLTAADSAGAYLAPDHVVYVRQGALVARRLDTARGELIGDPITLAPSVGLDGSRGGFSASAVGTLAHRAGGGAPGRPTWFSRTGKVLGQPGNSSANGPELSPDERTLAFDRTVQGNRDVWLMDLMLGGLTRFTFDAAVDGYPIWSPNGSLIVFESTRRGTFDIWTKPASGASQEQLLLETPDSEWPLHWSKDGGFVLYQRSNLREMWDLWALPMTGSDRTPVVVANTPFAERMGQFSPDSRWIAYETNESGRPEVIAQAFPGPSGRRQVSKGGGVAPRWRADGHELYFIAPDGTMMAAPITTTDSTIEVGTPAALFPTHIVGQPFKFQYTVARDGRFLVNSLPAEEATASPITVILNWKP